MNFGVHEYRDLPRFMTLLCELNLRQISRTLIQIKLDEARRIAVNMAKLPAVSPK
jgi:hypothetical protein